LTDIYYSNKFIAYLWHNIKGNLFCVKHLHCCLVYLLEYVSWRKISTLFFFVSFLMLFTEGNFVKCC